MTILVNVTYAQPIQIVTEQYPPYNYEQDGEIKGIGTEVVQAVFKEAGMAANIKVYPWARAYKNALKRENVLIYSISRTQQREKFFKWVGVIVPIDFYIYSLIERTDIHIDQLEGTQQYSIGTVRSDALEQLFTGKGFSKVHKSISNKIVMEMLFAERLDLWPISELAANHLLLQNNHALSSVRKVYHLEGFSSDGLYMAFGLQTSDSVVSTFKDALESIKRKGIYQDIIDKYVE